MKTHTYPSVQRPRFFAAAFLAFVLSATGALCGATDDLLMGNPSDATADLSHPDNYLMAKPYFTLSFNNSKGTPNWVSWRVIGSDIGGVKRVDDFRPDPDLPAGLHVIVPKDYNNSGFDRGHMCNFGDRSSTAESSDATFVMTNMVPQSPNLNEKAWETLEATCRDWASEHKHVYIIAGPYGQGGEGRHGKKDEIGDANKVTVPSVCWKVILMVDEGGPDDVKKVDEHTRIVAVIMPNDMTPNKEWASYRVSVRDVEKLTGYKFFTSVPAQIIEPLKDKVDGEPVTTPKHH